MSLSYIVIGFPICSNNSFLLIGKAAATNRFEDTQTEPQLPQKKTRRGTVRQVNCNYGK